MARSLETRTTKDRQNLTPNPVLEQKDLAALTATFPTPRLVADDDNQETADLHAREDLLLNNYTTDTEGSAMTTRIPIEKAMQLIAQRGLVAPATAAAPKTLMAGEHELKVQAPLTNGFARTGYELGTIEARHQKMEFEGAEKKSRE